MSFQNFSRKALKPKLDAAPGGKSDIQFVGDGNLQKSLNQGTPFAANTGLGVIFSRRWKNDDAGADGDGRLGLKHIQNIELSATINVASTADTLVGKISSLTGTAPASQQVDNVRTFGNYLLLPLNSKQATNLNFDVYFGDYEEGVLGKVAQVISGFNFRFVGSNINAILDKSNRNLTGLSYRFGFFHEFLGDDIRFIKDENDDDPRINYSVSFGLFYSYRRLAGDLSADSNEAIRTQLFGTSETVYRGLEVGLTLRLKNIRAEVVIPFLQGKNSKPAVPGLTNTQMITSINFIGGFPLKLN